MKQVSLRLLTLIFLILFGNIVIQAQTTTTANQVIIANGGRFETSPPYYDYVTIESYNLSTLAVYVFNTIYTQSVQDVLINNNYAYVTAQDSVVLYNIDSYQRIAAVKDSGLNKMAIYNNRLIVTKQYPVNRFRVEILDANTLSLIAFVDGIPGDCEGVTVCNTKAFVACDSGYAGTRGRLAIINTNNWQLDTIINFGTSAIGINNVYSYGGYIYCVNTSPYGAGNVGSITQFNPANYGFFTQTFALNIGSGYGIAGNLLYLGINNNIGAYDLDAQIMVDTMIIHNSGTGGNIGIHSVAVDYINDKFYVNLGNRISPGLGLVYTFTGDSLTSYSTGINADACAIDFRTPVGISNKGSRMDIISIFPNPSVDFININLASTISLKEIKILDFTGRTIETRSVESGENHIKINVLHYPSGIYLISFTTLQGTNVRKFIKN